MEKNKDFIMKPTLDFCFKELMTEEKVRQGFIGAILGVDPTEIKETRLMPTLLRKGSKEEKMGIRMCECCYMMGNRWIWNCLS